MSTFARDKYAIYSDDSDSEFSPNSITSIGKNTTKRRKIVESESEKLDPKTLFELSDENESESESECSKPDIRKLGMCMCACVFCFLFHSNYVKLRIKNMIFMKIMVVGIKNSIQCIQLCAKTVSSAECLQSRGLKTHFRAVKNKKYTFVSPFDAFLS